MNGGKCAYVSQHFVALGWSLSLGCFGRMFYLIKTIYIRYERASVETQSGPMTCTMLKKGGMSAPFIMESRRSF